MALLACLTAGCPAADPAPTSADVSDVADIADVGVDAPDSDIDDTDDTPDNAPDADVDPGPPDRAPGERRPLTARCDATDAGHCLLPWPSNVFSVADPSRDTGMRLLVEAGTLGGDDVTLLNRAGGFSRVNPIITSFPTPLDPATAELTLIVAEGARAGELEPVHCAAIAEETYLDGPHTGAIACYPHRPLAPNTEHLVIVRDTLRFADGAAVAADPQTAVALGLTAPSDDHGLALAAYNAPARAALAAAGIAPDTVLRLWDFTTRSAEEPRADLYTMRTAALNALDSGSASVVVDAVEVPPADSNVAIVVTGRITGMPGFVADSGYPTRDPDTGLPQPSLTIDAPFRAAVPKGSGDYRIVMFCHGTGGDVNDANFDELITGFGALKLGIEVEGWTGVDLAGTVSDLLNPLIGTERTAGKIVQSLAGSGAMLQAAIDGPLSDLLAAADVASTPNPAAGRRPLPDDVLWAGGSLGGMIGLIFGNLEPVIIGGVLNVPGAGFTHWIPASDLFQYVELGLSNLYESRILANLAVAMVQTLFDPMDGASWARASPTDPLFLVQISVDDPVVPNVASDLVATSLDAVHVGTPLYPLVGLDVADQAAGRSGVTQYNVVVGTPSANAVHGFTTRNTPAGMAAQAQFQAFALSLWADAPLITVPEQCLTLGPDPSCDFSAVLGQ